MRKLALVLLAAVVPSICLAELRKGAFTVRVIDETGVPVSNATVNAGAWERSFQGPFPGDKSIQSFLRLTDTNGMAYIEGRTQSHYSWGVKKEGYYPIEGMQCGFTNVTGRRHLPWNPLHQITLHKIINPIPMYARDTGHAIPEVTVPQVGQPCGFDLIISDWVKPYGQGEVADFVFNVNITLSKMPPGYYETYPGTVTNCDVTLQLAFTNPADGIQEYLDAPYTGSRLRLPRHAPDEGYNKSLRNQYIVTEGKTYSDMDRVDVNYMFRVRSHTDPSGVVTSALYGKIQGPFRYDHRGAVMFQYYLNPTPNDRNLEYAFMNLLKTKRSKESPPGP